MCQGCRQWCGPVGLRQIPVGCDYISANVGTSARVSIVLPSGIGCHNKCFSAACWGHRVICWQPASLDLQFPVWLSPSASALLLPCCLRWDQHSSNKQLCFLILSNQLLRWDLVCVSTSVILGIADQVSPYRTDVASQNCLSSSVFTFSMGEEKSFDFFVINKTQWAKQQFWLVIYWLVIFFLMQKSLMLHMFLKR